MEVDINKQKNNLFSKSRIHPTTHFPQRLSPVPVVELHVHGQGLQGDAAVLPEGDARHLPHQLVQLALQLLRDGQVVRVLGVLRLEVPQVALHRLVEGERAFGHLRVVAAVVGEEGEAGVHRIEIGNFSPTRHCGNYCRMVKHSFA